MIQEQFETPGSVSLQVSNRAGPVEVHTHGDGTTEVEVSALGEAGSEAAARTRVEHVVTDGRHRVVVEVPGRTGLLHSWARRGTTVRVLVRLPEGASIDIGTASGDLTAQGRVGPADVFSASGAVSLDRVDGDLRARSASGNIVVGAVSGRANIQTASGDVLCATLGGGGEIKTASGDVRVAAAGEELTVQTASGDVSTGDLADGCLVKTASGDLRVGRLSGGRAQLETVTGDIDVAVVRGALVAVDASTVSGSVRSDIDLAAEEPSLMGAEDLPRLELQARTVSGNLRIERAALV
jgi:DUF4097 and DUF4098 domain-containing protein YvlB